MTIQIGAITFDEAEYDERGDVLYLSVGEPKPAAQTLETPEGHAVHYDPAWRRCRPDAAQRETDLGARRRADDQLAADAPVARAVERRPGPSLSGGNAHLVHFLAPFDGGQGSGIHA